LLEIGISGFLDDRNSGKPEKVYIALGTQHLAKDFYYLLFAVYNCTQKQIWAKYQGSIISNINTATYACAAVSSQA